MHLTQSIAELYGCNPRLHDADALLADAKAAVIAVGATVVGETTVRYVPHGLTVAVYLAESHLVLTTWPEHRLVLVDLLLCNPSMDPKQVIASLAARLGAARVVRHDVPRYIGADPPA